MCHGMVVALRNAGRQARLAVNMCLVRTVVESTFRLFEDPSVVLQRRDFCRMRIDETGHVRFMRSAKATKLRLQG